MRHSLARLRVPARLLLQHGGVRASPGGAAVGLHPPPRARPPPGARSGWAPLRTAAGWAAAVASGTVALGGLAVVHASASSSSADERSHSAAATAASLALAAAAAGATDPPPLLDFKPDAYNGCLVTSIPDVAPADFALRLSASLAAWRAAGRRGVWLQLPVARADLLPCALAAGFALHHAEPGHVVLTAWLADTPSGLPPGASHHVGVGAFVLSPRGDSVLVVQERHGPAARPGFWKLPTGLCDPGEDVADAAVREVLEETGLETTFETVIGFRQAHGTAWGKSDLFFVCGLKLVGGDGGDSDGEPPAPVPQESEIAAARWMGLDEWGATPHVAGEATVWGSLNRLCVAWGRGEYAGIGAARLERGLRPGQDTVYSVTRPRL